MKTKLSKFNEGILMGTSSLRRAGFVHYTTLKVETLL